MDSLKAKLIYISLGLVAGAFFFWGATMLLQRNQARSERDLARGEADSFAFQLAQREAEIDSLKGIGGYKVDTVRIKIPIPLPGVHDTLWRDSTVAVQTVSFDTLKRFDLGRDTLGVRVKGKFYGDSLLASFNRLLILPEYWYHHENNALADNGVAIPSRAISIGPAYSSRSELGVALFFAGKNGVLSLNYFLYDKSFGISRTWDILRF
jgi:hypothetical protein